jgi:hypothetical protein
MVVFGLGVAVIGSVYASAYGSRLTATVPAGVPARVTAIAHQSVGAAFTASHSITTSGHPALGQALHLAASNAFLHALTVSALVAGAIAAAGAILAGLVLPAHPTGPEDTVPQDTVPQDTRPEGTTRATEPAGQLAGPAA